LPRSVTATAASSAWSRFDLDEDQRIAPARHDIDFAERRFPSARRDAVAFGHEQHGGAAFCGKPKPEGGQAVAFRFAPHLRLCGADHGAGSSFVSESARR
jgi:hypothetical protein